MTQSFRKSLHFIVFSLLILFVANARAQTYNGGLRGSITDARGAVIPKASITLTDETTHQVRSTTSNSDGAYAFDALRPSIYTLHVAAASFEAADRTHIALATQDFLTLDVQLAVGTAVDSVQVSAQAPLVDNATASISANFDQRRLEDIPVLGRNPYIAVGLSGVFVNTGNPQFIRFADQNGTTATSVAGGPIASNLYLIDGVPITDTNNRPIAIPTIESIQDVKVQALTYDAQVGRTGGGVFNTLLRSGTNALHGSIFGETRQTAWLANDFFANRNGIARPDSPYYNWGASLGGPVFIPHLYDGSNRTFFWIGSEGYIQTSPYTETFVVPTDLERSGNFSQDFNADGSPHVIYNPNDTYTDATGVHRRPFTGNVIGNVNTVGKNIVSYFPSPAAGTNEFTGTDDVRDHAQEVTVKLDQQIRPWWSVNGSYIFYEALQPLGNPLHTLPGSYSYIYHRQVDATQVNSTWILNPSTVLTARYGINRFPNLINEVSQGFDPSELGFPQSYSDNIQSKFFPTIFFANYSQLGQNTSQLDNWKSQIINGALSKSIGHHDFTFGAEYRRLRLDFQDYSNAPGTYTFTGAFTQANPNSSDGLSGDDIADLLLGYPVSGEVDLTTFLHTYLDYNAVFAQDDWRITRRLTLNLGLRWEAETGLKENNNQLAVGFNRTVQAQLSNGASVTGGILFAGVNGNQRDIGDLSRAKFAPRIGAAYQIDSKTVVRGGYGILYAPVRYDPIGALAPGYSQANNYVASTDNDQTSANSLSNPFPDGFQKPAGNSAGLLTGIGNSVTTYDQNFHAPRVQQFSVDVERDLPGHIALDAAYIGSRSTNLSPSPGGSTPININQLNPSNFSLGSSLSDQVANPVYVPGGAGILGQSTVARSQALRPFPQFTSVNLLVSSAHAKYDALLIKAEKRAARGLNLIASFTWSSNWDSSFATANSIQSPGSAAPQNVYNLEGEYARSVSNVPYRFVAGALYDLPFGSGERFATNSQFVDHIIGHWQLNVLPTFRSGFPISVYQSNNANSAVAGNGVQRPNLVEDTPLGTSGSLYNRLNGYINPAAFTASSAYTFGDAPRTLSLRGPGYANWDISLFKNIPIRDRVNIQFRAETFNTFNTPLFNGPNTALGSSNFGQITSMANFPRYLQLGLHITY
ncbi:outer membrane beta-barrel protein [Terracidiphilus gabretensis]|uniref:carboxypeptidase regulatory-like domain-containing protein n=1 Tax=Terracidiphilus gabretensis TaxID=1577687 RepID=UPI00071B7AD5|nr:carboxypeptidase regulatory-like domain-containing protein [Terracidiphilus gabretensis]